MMLRRTFWTVAILFAVAVPAMALHNHLTKSLPAADDVLDHSPTTVRLWFSEKPTPAFSSITVTDAAENKIPTSKMRATDDTLSVIADLQQSLPPGRYQVAWRTAGDDGHAVRGKFSFTVKP
jgi:methionine-rich copper-binding protein CopC